MTEGRTGVLGAGATGRGVVHLGAGAFARAHTWWATARAVDSEPGPWGVVAVAQRSRTVVEALRVRDWCYDVHLVGRDQSSVDTVALVRDGLVAREQPDRVLEALASPDTHVVTVTATEAGYPTTASGGLDLTEAAVADDLAGGPPRSLVGQLVAAAAARHERGAPALSVLVCDNVESGGRLLHRLAVDLAEARGLDGAIDDLATWSFPTSVVDRVVPAVAPGEEPDVRADPTWRWVVQDDFAGARPAWEKAGVLLVPDADPWQSAKLLLVNAPHSLCAYLGLALGHDAVGPAMGDPVVREAVEALLLGELVSCVPPAPGLDPVADAQATVRRFRGQSLPHALTQVGAGGSTKLPQRLRLAFDQHRSGRLAGIDWSALVVALWVRAVARGQVADPCAASLGSPADQAPRALAQHVLGLLGLDDEPTDPVAEVVADWLGRVVTGSDDDAAVRRAVATRLA